MLPLLFLGLLVFQLDRMNLASALTGGFAKDIGISQNTVNLGNQLMFLGIVVLEIPSNLILQRVCGAQRMRETMALTDQDWPTKMDIRSGICIRLDRYSSGLYQGTQRLPRFQKLSWTSGSGLHSWRNIHSIHMVHEA